MLLRRSKSGDLGKGGRKQREQELQRQREAIPKSPPRLPALYNGAQPPDLESFGDDNNRPDSLAIVSGHTHPLHPQYVTSGRQSMDPGRPSISSNYPMPPIPNGPTVDPYARTESMTHRGRYSYASSAISTINSPRRVRRRKDPTPFKYVHSLARSFPSEMISPSLFPSPSSGRSCRAMPRSLPQPRLLIEMS